MRKIYEKPGEREDEIMTGKRDSLLFRFAVSAVLFIVVVLLVGGISIYLNEEKIYHTQYEESALEIGKDLGQELMLDGEEFISLQKYFMEQSQQILIPYDFDGDFTAQKEEFETLFEEKYPDKRYGRDVAFEDLTSELKNVYATYRIEYWLNRFEKTEEAFDIPYAYYLVPTDSDYHMAYMIDAIREKKEVDGTAYLDLATDIYEAPEKQKAMWEAWTSGKTPQSHDVYATEYGHTYAYYTPLYINGEKIGLIGTEVYVDTVKKDILVNTTKKVGAMGLIFVVCCVIALWYLNRRYISKIVFLESNIREYAFEKDPMIAENIEKQAVGRDEIATLFQEVAAMIMELEDYMRNVIMTTQELSTVQKQADEVTEMVNRDELTGLRNRAAYNHEILRIDEALQQEKTEFGIAVVNVDHLSEINEQHGREKGDLAIQKICRLVCVTFEHSPVFKIDGDEFVIILENRDYENRDELVRIYQDELEKMKKDAALKEWERISASIGVALYDAGKDTGVDDVFERAFERMRASKEKHE